MVVFDATSYAGSEYASTEPLAALARSTACEQPQLPGAEGLKFYVDSTFSALSPASTVTRAFYARAWAPRIYPKDV